MGACGEEARRRARVVRRREEIGGERQGGDRWWPAGRQERSRRRRRPSCSPRRPPRRSGPAALLLSPRRPPPMPVSRCRLFSADPSSPSDGRRRLSSAGPASHSPSSYTLADRRSDPAPQASLHVPGDPQLPCHHRPPPLRRPLRRLPPRSTCLPSAAPTARGPSLSPRSHPASRGSLSTSIRPHRHRAASGLVAMVFAPPCRWLAAPQSAPLSARGPTLRSYCDLSARQGSRVRDGLQDACGESPSLQLTGRSQSCISHSRGVKFTSERWYGFSSIQFTELLLPPPCSIEFVG
ncbi:hypothetical protein BS78_07G164100 [Paspalum vaginatum]|nr:hypothetical protein BS78_07G164100 [Paspalum vaginatum]